MNKIEKQIIESILNKYNSNKYKILALIDKKSLKDAIEAEYFLYEPFIEVYKRESKYMKENGRWDFNLISEDVGLSIPTCRKWMKRIKTIIEN